MQPIKEKVYIQQYGGFWSATMQQWYEFVIKQILTPHRFDLSNIFKELMSTPTHSVKKEKERLRFYSKYPGILVINMPCDWNTHEWMNAFNEIFKIMTNKFVLIAGPSDYGYVIEVDGNIKGFASDIFTAQNVASILSGTYRIAVASDIEQWLDG